MTQALLSDPLQRLTREAIVTELQKGGWIQTKEDFTCFLESLQLRSPYMTALIQPLSDFFTVTPEDCDTLVKAAFATWINENSEMATTFLFSRLLRTHGFFYAADAVEGIGIPGITTSPAGESLDLSVCFKDCRQGTTIRLLPNRIYVGNVTIDKNKVTILGDVGTKIIGIGTCAVFNIIGDGCSLLNLTIFSEGRSVILGGKKNTLINCHISNGSREHFGILVTGPNSVIEGGTCTGSRGLAVKGRVHSSSVSHIRLQDLHLDGLVVDGQDVTVENVLIDGNRKGYGVKVVGTGHRLDRVKTLNCEFGLYCGRSHSPNPTKNCIFKNCRFAATHSSALKAVAIRMSNVDFVNGLEVLGNSRDILLQACNGLELVLAKDGTYADVTQDKCGFLKVSRKS